jgi:hypothetical protein
MFNTTAMYLAARSRMPRLSVWPPVCGRDLGKGRRTPDRRAHVLFFLTPKQNTDLFLVFLSPPHRETPQNAKKIPEKKQTTCISLGAFFLNSPAEKRPKTQEKKNKRTYVPFFSELRSCTSVWSYFFSPAAPWVLGPRLVQHIWPFAAAWLIAREKKLSKFLGR